MKISQKNSRLHNLLICSGVVGATLIGQANAAESVRPAFSYDPSRCKTDADNKLYIALGRNVLAVPRPVTGTVFGEIYPSMGIVRFTPPDTADGEGCQRNPLQLTSYAFNYQYQAGLASKWAAEPDARPRPEFLELGGAIRERIRVPVVAEGDSIKYAQATCARASIHEKLSNGLEACRVKPSIDLRIEDWAASYMAPENIYTTPLGNAFVVNCGPTLFSNGIGHCDVTYSLQSGLVVHYRFQPYRGSGAIPIQHVIEFDKDLQKQIGAVLVKNYAWPSQDQENGSPKTEQGPDASPAR